MGPTSPSPVVVADADPLACQMAILTIRDCPALRVIGKAASREELFQHVAPGRLVLLDPFSLDPDGVQLIRTLADAGCQVIVLTVWRPNRSPRACLTAGARALLSKAHDLSALNGAVGAAISGQIVLDSDAARSLWSPASASPNASFENCSDARGRLDTLTSLERAVLSLLAQGAETSSIASELEMKPATVRSHISHLLRKLGLSNRVQAACLAREQLQLDTVHDC